MAKSKKLPIKQSVPPEDVFQWFDIIYPTNKQGRRTLEDLIIGRGALNYVPYSLLNYVMTPENRRSSPICKSIVIEKRYRDTDHTKALSTFYSKSFRQVDTECVRLHFFASRIRQSDLNNLEKHHHSYLGFVVLRPFDQRRIGRTVLKRHYYDSDLEFSTCYGAFEVNIGGSQHSLLGPAFIEQDTMVAACASSAIWMSTTTLSRRYDLPQCSTSEITEKASQYLIGNRPMPSKGLLPQQMVHCLKEMGYDPVLLGASEVDQAKHDIYTYIESEIPPILLCELLEGGNHTIVGVGHGYQLPIDNPALSEVDWPGESPLHFARSSEWVPYFLVNDDQRGLYLRLRFIESDLSIYLNSLGINQPSQDMLSNWTCPVSIELDFLYVNAPKTKCIANVWGILIPLPQGVLLTGDQAERKAARFIRHWHWDYNVPLPQDLVLRTYLTRSNEYKRKITDSAMDVFLSSLIRGKPMPRWIWVTEVSTKASYNTAGENGRIINGTIIIDATSNAFTPDFLVIHYSTNHFSTIATMVPQHTDAEQALSWVWQSKGSSSYSGFSR